MLAIGSSNLTNGVTAPSCAVFSVSTYRLPCHNKTILQGGPKLRQNQGLQHAALCIARPGHEADQPMDPLE